MLLTFSETRGCRVKNLHLNGIFNSFVIDMVCIPTIVSTIKVNVRENTAHDEHKGPLDCRRGTPFLRSTRTLRIKWRYNLPSLHNFKSSTFHRLLNPQEHTVQQPLMLIPLVN